MNKNAKSKVWKESRGRRTTMARLPRLVRAALYATVISAGLACVDEALEATCGERYARLTERLALRVGPAMPQLLALAQQCDQVQNSKLRIAPRIFA